MLTSRGVHLNTFIMDNSGTNKEHIYGLWTKSYYSPTFSSLVHVEYMLLFQKISYLDINLYDNCNVRVEELLNYLNELFSAQKRLSNIRLVFPNGPGKNLINILKSQLESFKYLELAKWNFNDCDWKRLKKCPNLTEFAMTNPQTQVTDILGLEYDFNRLKISKNSKITTAHWHFDKIDKISLVSKFLFPYRKTFSGSIS
ncbi:hypothetical protein C2G38_2246373 [Gigaspora rosea]|uniref:Uncharacterized protein n=1 Tax=Gigaspora rosea TaxID=44941 RepID=A0A397V4T8_9GLOM|nr:hypothetical protein C2G38_2246373 [Gigaspora rosea]